MFYRNKSEAWITRGNSIKADILQFPGFSYEDNIVLISGSKAIFQTKLFISLVLMTLTRDIFNQTATYQTYIISL